MKTYLISRIRGDVNRMPSTSATAHRSLVRSGRFDGRRWIAHAHPNVTAAAAVAVVVQLSGVAMTAATCCRRRRHCRGGAELRVTGLGGDDRRPCLTRPPIVGCDAIRSSSCRWCGKCCRLVLLRRTALGGRWRLRVIRWALLSVPAAAVGSAVRFARCSRSRAELKGGRDGRLGVGVVVVVRVVAVIAVELCNWGSCSGVYRNKRETCVCVWVASCVGGWGGNQIDCASSLLCGAGEMQSMRNFAKANMGRGYAMRV